MIAENYEHLFLKEVQKWHRRRKHLQNRKLRIFGMSIVEVQLALHTFNYKLTVESNNALPNQIGQLDSG